MRIRDFILGGLWVLFAVLSSCTDDRVHGDNSVHVEPMLYSVDFTLEAPGGNGSGDIVSTKGIDYEYSFFTNWYPYDYIYVHSADNDELEPDGKHRSLRIPMTYDVAACDSCRGVHFQVDVHDDGSYSIIVNDGSIDLQANEEVYFSTIETSFWRAKQLEDEETPLSGSDIFVPGDNNAELLRSVENYSVDELLRLASQNPPQIPLARHCTGFRTRVMFTRKIADGYYILDASSFKTAVGYTPDHFFIKIYVGPAFCHSYDVFNDEVPNLPSGSADNGGYYVSRGNNQYEAFANVNYQDGGETVVGVYSGLGYQTAVQDLLLSPLNLNITENNPFTLYVFVKFAQDLTQLSDDFYASDDGAFWFSGTLGGMTTEPNYVYRSLFVYNVDELKKIVEWTTNPETFPSSESSSQTLTRGLLFSDFPKRIDAKPLLVLSEIE